MNVSRQGPNTMRQEEEEPPSCPAESTSPWHWAQTVTEEELVLHDRYRNTNRGLFLSAPVSKHPHSFLSVHYRTCFSLDAHIKTVKISFICKGISATKTLFAVAATVNSSSKWKTERRVLEADSVALWSHRGVTHRSSLSALNHRWVLKPRTWRRRRGVSANMKQGYSDCRHVWRWTKNTGLGKDWWPDTKTFQVVRSGSNCLNWVYVSFPEQLVLEA